MTTKTPIDIAIANRAYRAVTEGVGLYTATGLSRSEAMAATLTAMSGYIEALRQVTEERLDSAGKNTAEGVRKTLN